MPVDPELQTKIIAVVADVLAHEPEDVTPGQNFFHDLGGESIDVLDLQFQIEKQLGIRAPFQEMLSANHLTLDDAGRLAEAARMQLAKDFPFLQSSLDDCRTPYDLFTVTNIAAFIATRSAVMSPSNGTADHR